MCNYFFSFIILMCFFTASHYILKEEKKTFKSGFVSKAKGGKRNARECGLECSLFTGCRSFSFSEESLLLIIIFDIHIKNFILILYARYPQFKKNKKNCWKFLHFISTKKNTKHKVSLTAGGSIPFYIPYKWHFPLYFCQTLPHVSSLPGELF